MKPSITDRIPSRRECDEIMTGQDMLPHIAAHSLQVMNVALVITDNLRAGVDIDRDLIIAAALLHDITKTRSLETKEPHDRSGARLLKDMGFRRIAEIVAQHVTFRDWDPEGGLEAREIIYYADKRVLHDRIVSIDERVEDLIRRYGTSPEIRDLILQNKALVLAVEGKIAANMGIDIHRAIRGIATQTAQNRPAGSCPTALKYNGCDPWTGPER